MAKKPSKKEVQEVLNGEWTKNHKDQIPKRPETNLIRKPKRARSNKEIKLTNVEYDEMFEDQDGECAICKIDLGQLARQPAVDHCHKTGKVRGILCGNCNSGIGMLGDNPDRIEAAALYLRLHEMKERHNLV